MFSRNFMRIFPVRKYADITAKTGSVNTDIYMHSPTEYQVHRPIIYIMVTGLLLLVFDNFHTMDEIIGHQTRPYASTVYENQIPKEVLYNNLEIIEGFQAINKMKTLRDILAYEK